MAASQKNVFTQQEIRDLDYVFCIFDEKETGLIANEDLRRALKLLDFKVGYQKLLQMSRDIEASYGHKKSSMSSRNSTSKEVFLQIVAELQASSYDLQEEMIQGFKLLDADSDGLLSPSDLQQHGTKIGLSFSDLRGMLEEADKDGDGTINLDEFLSIMEATNLFKS